MPKTAKLVFHLSPQATWNANDAGGNPVYSFKNGDFVDAEIDQDGKPTDEYLRNAVEAGIAFIGSIKQGPTPTQLDSFDGFLRKLDPLMRPPPLYNSLEFACVAGRLGTEWIVISGKAVLNTEPCAADAQIAPLVRLSELVAHSGRIRADAVNDLAANLRDSWVVRGLKRDNVRLTAEGGGGYNWATPAVYSVDKSWNPSSRWGRAFALYGNGPNLSSLLSYSALQEIDSQLRRTTPAFNGFDGLCGKLGLPVRRSNLTSSLQVSAELPARFANVHTDSAKGTLEFDIECIGAPDLMIEWLPQHEFQRVPPGWNLVSTNGHHHVSLPVPDGATSAELVLSFGELDADTARVETARKKASVPDSELSKRVRTDERERWKGTGMTLGEGGQAQVFVVEDTRKEYTGQWALKTLKNIDNPKAKERFGQEVKAVQSINHPNILRIIHSDLSAERPYFVAEYCERGSLQKIGASRYKGNILATKEVVLPILDALVAAHRAGVFHRDVKPANILLRGDDTPVIGDFGICFMEGGQCVTLSNEAVGSRNFIAPEMESGQHPLGEPSDRTDVYSLGKVIYWMLSGGKEFAREDCPSLVDLLKDQRFEHVQRLLAEMVVMDPVKRIHSPGLREKLETTASLVEGNFAPLKPSIGIRCRFCGIGQYRQFAAYDGQQPSKPWQTAMKFRGLGIDIRMAEANARALQCGHCGHIELFQFGKIDDPTWWDK